VIDTSIRVYSDKLVRQFPIANFTNALITDDQI
jgi:hypothetical protein